MVLFWRAIRHKAYRFRLLLFAVVAVWGFCILPDGITLRSFFPATKKFVSPKEETLPSLLDAANKARNRGLRAPDDDKRNVKAKAEREPFLLSSKKYGDLWIEGIVGDPPNSLHEKMNADVVSNSPAKVLLSWDIGHGQENLGGCPDWNCKFSRNRADLEFADAVLAAGDLSTIASSRTPEQYIVFFSQESAANAMRNPKEKFIFNMSLGFRRDSPASSPYGYTVKLAAKSRREKYYVDNDLVHGKTKTAAWFVSHCDTHSQREGYIKELKKHIEVDVYGLCGTLKCARGGECENALDKDYHFYIAFENSVCRDYLTEKLWHQGYQRTIVPVVLSREILEPFAPPHSFIAVDDFRSPAELAAYMHYLIENKTAYLEYFEWRMDYAVIFLDGSNHDFLERPWGFCQLCRLVWSKERKAHEIKDFEKWWGQSCERNGQLVHEHLNTVPSAVAPPKAAKKDSKDVQKKT